MLIVYDQKQRLLPGRSTNDGLDDALNKFLAERHVGRWAVRVAARWELDIVRVDEAHMRQLSAGCELEEPDLLVFDIRDVLSVEGVFLEKSQEAVPPFEVPPGQFLPRDRIATGEVVEDCRGEYWRRRTPRIPGS